MTNKERAYLEHTYNIDIVTNNESQRKGLIHFLATFEGETRSEEFWRNRLDHWWKENPFYEENIPKGWILTFQEEIVGFLGVIASEYLYRDNIYKALATTTWRVAAKHRKYSLRLLTKFQGFRNKYILLNTTPNDVAKKVFTAYKYHFNDAVHNYYFPIRQATTTFTTRLFNAAHFLQNLVARDIRLKWVYLDDNFYLEQSAPASDHLTRNISRAYLNWQCQAQSFNKEFIGCVQDDNKLSSYLILKRNKIKKINALQVIDYHTTCNDSSEILALIKHVCDHPETLPLAQGCNLLVLSSFVSNGLLFEKKPAYVISKSSRHPQYFSTPTALNGVNKLCHLLEGDYGL